MTQAAGDSPTTVTGLVAAFESERALRQALSKLRAEGLDTTTYSPKMLEDGDMSSPIGALILTAGAIGVTAGFAMQVYANVIAYPLDIGGRPKFSWPAFIPIAFEIGVLFAVLAGVFGYLILARLPRLYDPVDDCQSMRRVMRDEWALAVRAADTEQLERARATLQQFHPKLIEALRA